MAVYHFSAQMISRGRGQSATAAAAYRCRLRITDERTGRVHDYSRRGGVDGWRVLAPEGAADWVKDPAQLWNRAAAAERRKDAQEARDINLALPRELSPRARWLLTKEFCQREFVDRGMVAAVALHDGSGDNPHAHILLTTRRLTADGEGFGLKAREWNSKDMLEGWRAAWARDANAALKQRGHSARIDHRTLAAQGIQRTPTQHAGKAASMAARGVPHHRTRTTPGAGAQAHHASAAPRPAPATKAAAVKAGPAPKAGGGGVPGAVAFVRPTKSAPGAKQAAREWKKEAARAAEEWGHVAASIAAATATAREDLARMLAAIRGSSGKAPAPKPAPRRVVKRQEAETMKQEQKQEPRPTLAAKAGQLLPGVRMLTDDAVQAIQVIAQVEGRSIDSVRDDFGAYLESSGKAEREELRRALSAWRWEWKPIEKAAALDEQRRKARRAAWKADQRAHDGDDDRLNWQHARPRPGIAHPLARAKWDAEEAQRVADIEAEKKKAEKARETMPSAGEVESAARVARLAVAPAGAALRKVAEMVKDQHHAAEAEPDMVPATTKPKLAATLGAALGHTTPAPTTTGTTTTGAPSTAGAATAEQEQRRRRRRRK